jgi:hypothetical protein
VLLPVVLSNASLSAAPPPGLEATFRLGSAQVSPGADVRVPIFVSSNEPLAGLSISVDFDEEVLEATTAARTSTTTTRLQGTEASTRVTSTRP